MKTMFLTDHELTVTDFSNFELKLQAKAAVCHATVDTYTKEQGMERARLTNPSIEFDEATTSEAEIEQLCQVHGFQRKAP